MSETCAARFQTLLRAAGVATFVLATCGSAAADVINACITKSTGQVRIVATTGQCKSNEAPLSWNVAGPAGPAGPAGEPGPAGLVAGYQAEASGGPTGTALNSFISGDLLTSVNLPAGNWAVFARVRISRDTSSEYVAECSIRQVSASLTKDETSTLETQPAGALTNSKIISMMSLAELAADDTVELRCNDSLTQSARWNEARIVAIQITTIN